jgi:ubiquinone/menaquinone biosynthesis C-methylase UbiE
MIAEANRKRADAHCSFAIGKAEALDLPDASFDVVLSSLAIHTSRRTRPPARSPRCSAC